MPMLLRTVMLSLTALLIGVAHANAAIINPGGASSLGTLHYLNTNVALGSGYGGTALPGYGSTYVSQPVAGAFGPTDGSGGNNNVTGGLDVYFGGMGGGTTYRWRVNLGSQPSTPNPSNQSYALQRIEMWGRGNGSDESDGFMTVYNGGVPTAQVNGMFLDSINGGGDPGGNVTLNFTNGSISGLVTGLISQGIEYNKTDGCCSFNYFSFAEVKAFGLTDFLLGGSDTLQMEIDGTGNDYLNVQGTATLNGALSVTTINGFNYTSGSTYNLLTAGSINISGLSFDPTIDSGHYFSMQVISGGQGQILQLEVMTVPAPEPSTALLLGLGTCLLANYRRRKLAS